ncbi:MAG: CAP domain-containing protein, partial [Dietzia sp.]
VVPPEVARKAFEGSVVAGVNEARTAVGAERLVTDAVLSVEAGVRADQLAVGDPTTGDLPVPESGEVRDRTVLTLPPEATPQNVLTAMLTDTGMRERMLDGEFTKVGVGTATDEDGRIHVVLDFERD